MTFDEPSKQERIAAIVDRLQHAETVVVSGHVNPDGDALGSSSALVAALRQRDVDATLTWGSRAQEEPPMRLPKGWDQILPALQWHRPPEMITEPVDVFVACDTAAIDRLGTAAPIAEQAKTVIVIDHHEVGGPFGDLEYIDPEAVSAGGLMLDVLDRLDIELTPKIANALYLSMLTDSGRFGFDATTGEDHRKVARLHDAGADHAFINTVVFNTAAVGVLDLIAKGTAHATVHKDVIATAITQKELTETGLTIDDCDVVLDLLRRVDTCDVSALLRETGEGTWRTSLRSRGATNVAGIAESLGGGGHRFAAGMTVSGSVDDVINRIVSLVKDNTL